MAPAIVSLVLLSVAEANVNTNGMRLPELKNKALDGAVVKLPGDAR